MTQKTFKRKEEAVINGVIEQLEVIHSKLERGVIEDQRKYAVKYLGPQINKLKNLMKGFC